MLSLPPHRADCQARLRACLVPLTCCCRRRHCLKVQHQSPLVWDQHYDLPVDHGEGGRGGIPVPQFSPRCVLLCDLAVTLVGYLAIRGMPDCNAAFHRGAVTAHAARPLPTRWWPVPGEMPDCKAAFPRGAVTAHAARTEL